MVEAEPARHWRPLPNRAVECLLCPQGCHVPEGGRGLCRVRRNYDGKLAATNYGLVSALGLDPVEKKPLYHFHPGATVLSLGTAGCNLQCGFCQNWSLAHGEPPSEPLSPAGVVRLAREAEGAGRGCIGLAYTYAEPGMWFEYVLDTARPAHEAGLANVLVTNGYINPEPLDELLPWIDALNIDVKAMSDRFYRRVCRGRLEPVLRTVARAHSAGCHVEVTNLVIPGHNDGEEDIERLSRWLAGVGRNVPLHLSRYFPHRGFPAPPTPIAALERAREVAARHLNYVYIGNVWESEGSDTRCHNCGALLISRTGFHVVTPGLEAGKCASCAAAIPVVGGPGLGDGPRRGGGSGEGS